MRVGADEYDDGETPYDYDSESPPPLEPRSPKGSLNSTVAAPRDVGDGNHQRGHFLPIQAATEAAAGTAAAARAEANARAKEDMAATAAVTLKEKTYVFLLKLMRVATTDEGSNTFSSMHRM